jgi:diguanylate cyclase (GGDEF)-like protein/PAS domain S-box-containing protein
MPAAWRWRFAAGIGLTVLLLVAAMVLAWREQQARERQVAAQAELVVDGIERHLRDRLGMLVEDLSQAAAGLAPPDTPEAPGPGDAHGRSHGIVSIRVAPVAAGGNPPAGTADQPLAALVMHPPEAGAGTLGVSWTGTPGVRVDARVDADWIAEVVRDLALPETTTANLVHGPSQRIYARSHDNPGFLGRELGGTMLFAPGHRDRREGSFIGTSVLDGMRRQFVYQRIVGTPLIAVVGTPRQEIAAPAAGFVATVLLAALALGAMWLWLLRAFEANHGRQEQLLRQLEQAQQMAVLGTWRWRIDSHEVEWGGESARIYGFPPDTRSAPLNEIMRRIHPDDLRPVAHWMEMARTAGREELAGLSIEYRVVRDDGSMRWVLARVEADDQDDTRALVGVQQDITAQVADRERLRLAQDIARTGDWEWDVASGSIHWSPTMYDIYGLDPATFRPDAESAFARIHPEDRERVQAMSRDLAEHGKPCQTEFRILRGDGTVRVLSVRGMREVAADGRVVIRSVQQDITELAQAREALHRAERQYRFLFERNPMPMWVFDPVSLRFLAANEAMLREYGYPHEELLGMTILDIRPAADRARAEDAARAPAAERPQGGVWTHLRQDGSARRMAVHTTDIDFEGRPARLVAAQDVTERELNEQRFRMVARATSDAIYDYDVQSGRLWWSDSYYEAFGVEPGEASRTLDAWKARVHPDDVLRASESLDLALVDPAAEHWEAEYRFRRGDGEYTEVVDRGFFVRDEAGRATRVVGGMLDVSQKRRHESDLRLLSRAVEAVGSGVTIADARAPDMPLVYVNHAFEQMTGYSARDCLGRNCRFLQGGDREQHGVEGVRHAIERGREARVLLRNYRRDGSMFWNELYMAPVLDADGILTHFVGIQTDVSDQHRYQQELAYRATHDALTGLPNRQLLHDRLQQAILNAERYGRHAVAVFLDLDDFKLINDNLDHAAGDEALRIVANRLQAQVRETDTVGRFGGDEFVVVLTEQGDEEGVDRVIGRITRALSSPMDIGGSSHVLTPSIGWARYPDDGGDADTLLKHADMAMYLAKRGGRNRSERYRADLGTHVSQRVQLLAQLRTALEHGQFRLAFQPLYDGEGRIRALEALVRWQHPERGLLLPAEFIGVCEESGLMLELGRWILREAARHHGLLVARGLGEVRIAVNVSAMQFGPVLERDVAAALAEFALPRGVLELEITESVVMQHPDLAIETMRRLADLGVSIAIDDFGTGYSSLAYLRRLPLDRLKIDRSFVRDLPHEHEAASICGAILQLARSLDLAIVGEGVETAEQLHWLRDHGCDEMQGFLLARPAPFEEIMALPGQGAGAAT